MPTELIRPSNVRPLTVRCTVVDVLAEVMPLPLLFFYEKKLDTAALAHALERALSATPEFAGRIAREDGSFLIRCGGQGVPFTVASSERTLADALDSAAKHRSRWLFDDIGVWGARNGRSALLTVRVTHLADGATVIGCCWHHSVGDVASIAVIMRAWVATAAGDPVTEALPIEDRAAYLSEHLPPDSARQPTYRKLGFGEILGTLVHFGSSAAPRPVTLAFTAGEVSGMRDAYGPGLSTNDVVCAHVAETFAAADPSVTSRNLTIVVNLRRRCGLSPSLLGNPLGLLGVPVDRDDRGVAIAKRIRHGVDHFAGEHLDVRNSQASLGDDLGVFAPLKWRQRAFDFIRHDLLITSACNYGLYDLPFEGTSPTFVSLPQTYPSPWIGTLLEGTGGRGIVFAVAVPPRVAKALAQPELQARLRRFS